MLSAVQFLREGIDVETLALTPGVAAAPTDATGSEASAPAASLSENPAPDTANQSTVETAATAPAANAPAELNTPDDPNESPGLKNQREHIKRLEAQLAELDPYAKEIKARVASPDELRPVVGLIDAARVADPNEAAKLVGDQLYEYLGEERYTKLVQDLHERHKEQLSALGQPLPAAERPTDDAVPEPNPDDYDTDGEYELAVKLHKANAELNAVRATQSQYERQQQEFAATRLAEESRQRVVTLAQAVQAPLSQALAQLDLGELTDETRKRIRADVMADFDSDATLQAQLARAAQLAETGQPEHLYSADRAAMAAKIAELTEKALTYHTRAVAANANPQAKAAAALADANARMPQAARGAQPVVSATNAQPATPPQITADKSAKAQLFDKNEMRRLGAELQASGRF